MKTKSNNLWKEKSAELALQTIFYKTGVTNVMTVGTKPPAKTMYVAQGACSKNNNSMIIVFTLTSINTKIIKDKLSNIFISEVCIKLVALRINRYAGSSTQFQRGWWPLL